MSSVTTVSLGVPSIRRKLNISKLAGSTGTESLSSWKPGKVGEAIITDDWPKFINL